MMRKTSFVVMLLLVCLSLFAVDQAEEGVDYAIANVYFAADLHSIFGFSSEYVDTAIQPDVMQEEIVFEHVGNNLIRTNQFYVYYQIFSPNKIRISLSVADYVIGEDNFTPRVGNDSVWWQNVATSSNLDLNDFNSESTDVVVYADEESGNTPRVNSFPLVLDLNKDKLADIDWTEQYKWKLVLKIEELS